MAEATLHETTEIATPPSAEPLLDFATAWLERWTEKGGSAYLGRRGKLAEWETLEPRLMISFPTYHFSPAYEDHLDFCEEWRRTGLSDLSEENQDRHIRDRHTFDQYFHEGKVRELNDLLDAVPGGYEAVEAIIKVAPDLGVGRQLRNPDRLFGRLSPAKEG